MKLSKKKMFEALESRYHFLDLKDGVNLYDKTRKAHMMNGGAFVAQIKVGNSKYYYQDKEYTNVEDLSKAIDAYVDTLPFNCEFYDPTYRKHIFVELCCQEYIKKLGLERVSYSDESFVYKNPMSGEVVFKIEISTNDDTTTGKIYKTHSDNSWEEMEFTDLDGAIANINSMLAVDALLIASGATKILNDMNNLRAKGGWNKKSISMKTFETTIVNMKNTLIEHLEMELKSLKEME